MTQPSTNKPEKDKYKDPSRFPADKPKTDIKDANKKSASTDNKDKPAVKK